MVLRPRRYNYLSKAFELIKCGLDIYFTSERQSFYCLSTSKSSHYPLYILYVSFIWIQFKTAILYLGKINYGFIYSIIIIHNYLSLHEHSFWNIWTVCYYCTFIYTRNSCRIYSHIREILAVFKWPVTAQRFFSYAYWCIYLSIIFFNLPWNTQESSAVHDSPPPQWSSFVVDLSCPFSKAG